MGGESLGTQRRLEAVSAQHCLDGRRVWVTAERRSEHQRRYLERRGAAVDSVSVLETVDETTPMDIATLADSLCADPPGYVIAQTGQGIDWWLGNLDESRRCAVLKALGGATLWTRGPKASSRCRGFGLEVDWQAPNDRATELAERARAHIPSGARVALQLVGSTNDVVVEALNEIGADVTMLRVYRYTIPADRAPIEHLVQSTINGEVDAITFTASPAILHLQQVAQDMGVVDELRAAFAGPCKVVVVGPVCAATTQDVGWPEPIEPDTARLVPMLDVLTETLNPTC